MARISISRVLNTQVGERIAYSASFSVYVSHPGNASRSSQNAIKSKKGELE